MSRASGPKKVARRATSGISQDNKVSRIEDARSKMSARVFNAGTLPLIISRRCTSGYLLLAPSVHKVDFSNSF
ncbi:MAG: hypothetical protein AUG51_01195 [Acidobacteria bacterium 13_1_20CM_3_53_8]|nr:MAG: hypothetical protein AUG51_01195 [Acidobacteria bacterium 13_1_20CM_3_53_8]